MPKPRKPKLRDPACSDEFYQGFAVGMADLIRGYDQPSVAIGIMQSNGIYIEDLRNAKVEQFDLKPLEKAWKSEIGPRAGRRK